MSAQKVSVVVMGPGGVGKSAITLRFMRNEFIEEYDPTIEDSYSKVCMVDGIETNFSITDTAGQEEYRDLWNDKFTREADGFLLVYSITSRESFEELRNFRDRILRSRDGLKCPMIILGNKKDLEQYREVSEEDGRRFAMSFGAQHMETSAKAKLNVDKSFFALANLIRQSRGGSTGPKSGREQPQPSKQARPSGHGNAGGQARPKQQSPSKSPSRPGPGKKQQQQSSSCCVIS